MDTINILNMYELSSYKQHLLSFIISLSLSVLFLFGQKEISRHTAEMENFPMTLVRIFVFLNYTIDAHSIIQKIIANVNAIDDDDSNDVGDDDDANDNNHNVKNAFYYSHTNQIN